MSAGVGKVFLWDFSEEIELVGSLCVLLEVLLYSAIKIHILVHNIQKVFNFVVEFAGGFIV